MSHSSLFTNYQVVITSLGPDNYSWVRGRRADTGEDAFVHGPDDESFPIKHLEPGMRLNTHSFRDVEKDGPTRWAAAALTLNLQTPEIRQLFQLDEYEETTLLAPVSIQVTKEQRKVLSRPRFNMLRQKKVHQIINSCGFKGKYAESDAVAHCIDLCIEHNLA